MVNFGLTSIQTHVILLEQNQIQVCIFFWINNKDLTIVVAKKKKKKKNHCESPNKKEFSFASSIIR